MVDADAWSLILESDPRKVRVKGDFLGDGLFYSEEYIDENRQRSRFFLETDKKVKGDLLINGDKYVAKAFEVLSGGLFKTILEIK